MSESTDLVGADIADGVEGLHLVHGVHHLLLLLLLLDSCLLSFGAHLALGDVRCEGVARLPGGLNTVEKVGGLEGLIEI